MEEILRETTHRQRQEIAGMLHERLTSLAERCVAQWGDREQLNQVLVAGFPQIPCWTFLYVLNSDCVQVSDNVGGEGVVLGHFGRDRSKRPYMREAMPTWGFLLSDAYISLLSRRPSLTALHVLRSGDQLLGYLGANFDLRDLPVSARLYEEPAYWRQIKGEPSIRHLLFQQSRIESPMDRNMDQATSILEELLAERGMFQGLIHFSSSRATVWTLDDPYRYRILDQEALADPDICLAFPRRPYPPDVLIPQASLGLILNAMRELRTADETIYLRSASINLFNGMISLTFSCDGSHYMRYDEFLEKNLSFWFGNAA